MPEEGLETAEISEHVEHAREHGHGHGGGLEGWIMALSLSTAILAVLAAVASLESGKRSYRCNRLIICII